MLEIAKKKSNKNLENKLFQTTEKQYFPVHFLLLAAQI